ncbi:hypothetical protein TW95_gp1781 [Pandoravirus inopinatum]|uniref:Uncharacterized protein n=1 Tax=Pandoravirus inopinatum TaxID=1605721 RepID=A0A0B5J963_9VIRU|nr:hypothetical protein TW95_gp1781 [Pandoravirus inopinatum]AJF98515.1 hypothetical protein [Pandoravirus inopinatum]
MSISAQCNLASSSTSGRARSGASPPKRKVKATPFASSRVMLSISKANAALRVHKERQEAMRREALGQGPQPRVRSSPVQADATPNCRPATRNRVPSHRYRPATSWRGNWRPSRPPSMPSADDWLRAVTPASPLPIRHSNSTYRGRCTTGHDPASPKRQPCRAPSVQTTARPRRQHVRRRRPTRGRRGRGRKCSVARAARDLGRGHPRADPRRRAAAGLLVGIMPPCGCACAPSALPPFVPRDCIVFLFFNKKTYFFFCFNNSNMRGEGRYRKSCAQSCARVVPHGLSAHAGRRSQARRQRGGGEAAVAKPGARLTLGAKAGRA